MTNSEVTGENVMFSGKNFLSPKHEKAGKRFLKSKTFDLTHTEEAEERFTGKNFLSPYLFGSNR